MADFGINVDPGEAGMDARRLQRIDAHFRRYVDDGRLAGWQVMVSRHGKVVHLASYGLADKESGRPVETDTLWRVFSMTKSVTSVAAMMLWEEGAFELSDPISRWLPEFAAPRVYTGGPAAKPVTVPATEPIRVWHLLTHTAGLTYGFHRVHVLDELHRLRGFDVGAPEGLDLAACVRAWSEIPLMFQPGAEWNYSVATDVLGRLIEVISGKPLEVFFAERILGPLGMKETTFGCPEDRQDRLAALYTMVPGRPVPVRAAAVGKFEVAHPSWLSGGSGLVSSTRDFTRFTWMLLNGGELDGARLLSPRTVRYMTRNHLPGGVDLAAYGRALFAETRFNGVGFGLGFGVVIDPIAYRSMTSVGEYHWGGFASTTFWVDPAEHLTVVFMTQLIPSNTHPIRTQLRQLVYQSLVD
jgi:CubicO group peptidase (beta-lactamase class C family)